MLAVSDLVKLAQHVEEFRVLAQRAPDDGQIDGFAAMFLLQLKRAIGELVVAQNALSDAPSPGDATEDAALTPAEIAKDIAKRAAEIGMNEHRQTPDGSPHKRRYPGLEDHLNGIGALPVAEALVGEGPIFEDGGPPYLGLRKIDGSADEDSGLLAGPASCPEGAGKAEAPGQGPTPSPPE